MNGDAVIPFGKHAGKTVQEIMMRDAQYVQWLMAQAWFKDKYAPTYNLIVNNFGSVDNDTPEHNKLCAKFLDDDFAIAVLEPLEFPPTWRVEDYTAAIHCDDGTSGSGKTRRIKQQLNGRNTGRVNIAEREFEHVSGWDVRLVLDYEYEREIVSNSDEIAAFITAQKTTLQEATNEWKTADNAKRAKAYATWLKGREKWDEWKKADDAVRNGQGRHFVLRAENPHEEEYKRAKITWDAATRRLDGERCALQSVIEAELAALTLPVPIIGTELGGEFGSTHFIECKPCMGDDFPEVLRQCKKQKNFITGARQQRADTFFHLVLGEYSGASCSLDVVQSMFESSNIAVTLLDGVMQEDGSREYAAPFVSFDCTPNVHALT